MKTRTVPNLKLLMAAVLLAGQSCFFHVAQAQVNYADSLALVEFYSSTNGPAWSSSDNWLTGPVSTWEGVTVESGRVTSIYLPFKNLSGTVPYHIGFLHKLTFFGIPGNSVGGSIPSAILFLTGLESIDLSDNAFTGAIPPLLGLNLKLRSVNLSRNQLTGPIPATFVLLQNMTYLDLSSNQLSGQIPPAIGFLKKLEKLYLYDNKLTGSIPQTIGAQRHVVEINVADNLLTGTIPASVSSLDSLVRFNVSNNDLTGNVPAGIATLPLLSQLDVSGNELSGLPNLSAVTSLVQLRVRDNRFTFEDLEPNKPKMASASLYIPQDSVGTEQSITVCEGDSLVLSADFTGSLANNRYRWLSTDGTFSTAVGTSPALIIPNVQPADAKTYYARCTNTVVTGLNIIRRPVQVTVVGCAASGFTEATSVYPTEFSEQTTLKIVTEQDEALEVVILNEEGNVEQSYHDLLTNREIKFGSGLKKGLYFVQTSYNGKRSVTRVIKK